MEENDKDNIYTTTKGPLNQLPSKYCTHNLSEGEEFKKIKKK